MASTVELMRSRDAIVKHITQIGPLWAQLQKEHTIVKTETGGAVLYKENQWLDELKANYVTAPLSDFQALIEAIDTHLMNALSGPSV